MDHVTAADAALAAALRFQAEDAYKAGDDWGFNCGPGALCGILNWTPDELRPFLGEFEDKGYTNPSLMFAVLTRIGAVYRKSFRSDEPLACYRRPAPHVVSFGLVRIQWGGRWTKPGVPMAARYRKTHWVAVRGGDRVFDINAISVGGWITTGIWRGQLVPWILEECCKDGDGTWWPTHGIEILAAPAAPVAVHP